MPLAAGFLIGGSLGPAIVRRLPAPALRLVVGVYRPTERSRSRLEFSAYS